MSIAAGLALSAGSLLVVNTRLGFILTQLRPIVSLLSRKVLGDLSQFVLSVSKFASVS
jgi:hypothetical protein